GAAGFAVENLPRRAGRVYRGYVRGRQAAGPPAGKADPMTYMLDTNICIYVMKKKPEAALRRFRQEMDGGLCISSVTLAELEFGVQNSSDPIRNGQALLRFLAPLSVLPFGPAAASEYGAVRAFLQKKGTPIGPLRSEERRVGEAGRAER